MQAPESHPRPKPPLLRVSDNARAITRLGAPLIAFFLVQNVVNLAVLAVLGHVGDAALAGVGVASAVYGVILALLFGVDTGVQAIVARATGAGRQDRLGEVLADAMAVAMPVAALLAAVLWFLGPAAIKVMLPGKEAADAGSAWVRAAAPSLVFYAATVPINSCWIGSGRPGIAFLVTALLAPLQILLTLLFVLGFGPIQAEGAAGGATAMSLAGLAGVGAQFALAARIRPIPGFLRSAPRAVGIAAIANIGWPVSIQQSLAQLGLMVAFIVVAQLGTGPTAIVNVLISLTSLPLQSAVGIGVAAATLVGQSLGRGDVAEARRWGWRTSWAGVLLTAPFALIALAFPSQLLGAFLHDPATLALAIWPARIVALGLVADALGRIFSFALRGSGATKLASIIPFSAFWVFELPLLWWLGVHLRYGLAAIVTVQVSVAVTQALVMVWIWSTSSWTRVRLGDNPPPAASAPPAAPARLSRVAIMGGAGAGKSTLARRVGAALGLPVVHLDRLVHGPGWAKVETQAVREALSKELAPGAWVVEGTYPELADLTLPAADLVIWIEQPAWLRLWRTWRKTQINRGRPRADRPDGCEEAFGWSYVRTVLEFGSWTERLESGLKASAGGRVIRLRGDRAVQRFAAGLNTAAS